MARALLERAGSAREQLPGGPTALHDFRVALRRLRSWLRAFRPWLRDTSRGRTRRSLAALADASSVARDTEVGLEWLDAQRDLPVQARAQLRQLQRRMRHELRDAQGEFARVLASSFDRTARALDGELREVAAERSVSARANPPTHAAYVRLVRAHASRLGAELRRVRTVEHEEYAHRARIAGKRLRYLLEPLADTAARAAVRRLVRLQDALGELHDATVCGARLESAHSVLAHRARERTSRAFARVARGWLGARGGELAAAMARVADGAPIGRSVS